MPLIVDQACSAACDIALLGRQLGFDVTVTQLESGPFEGRFRLAQCGHHGLLSIQSNRKFLIFGKRPPDRRAFGVLLPDSERRLKENVIHGYRLDEHCVAGWKRPRDVSFLICPPGEVLACMIPKEEALPIIDQVNEFGALDVGPNCFDAFAARLKGRLNCPDEEGACDRFLLQLRNTLRLAPGSKEPPLDRAIDTTVRVLQEMAKQGSGRIDFGAMRESLGLSEKTLRQHCGSTFGGPPKKIEVLCRLERGRALIKHHQERVRHGVAPGIESVAQFLEFSDAKSFGRAYKNHFGCTPSSEWN